MKLPETVWFVRCPSGWPLLYTCSITRKDAIAEALKVVEAISWDEMRLNGHTVKKFTLRPILDVYRPAKVPKALQATPQEIEARIARKRRQMERRIKAATL